VATDPFFDLPRPGDVEAGLEARDLPDLLDRLGVGGIDDRDLEPPGGWVEAEREDIVLPAVVLRDQRERLGG